MLVEAGANVNAVDRSFGDLNTPAHKALLAGRKDIAEYLIGQGANTIIQNASGFTVMFLLNNPKELERLIDNDYQSREQDNGLLSYEIERITTTTESKDVLNEFPLCSRCRRPSMAFSQDSKGNLVCSNCRKSS
jgi:ankyrin repeat protein